MVFDFESNKYAWHTERTFFCHADKHLFVMPNDSEASIDLGEKYLHCLADRRRWNGSFAIAQDDKVIAQDDKIIVQTDKITAVSSATRHHGHFRRREAVQFIHQLVYLSL